MFLTLENNKRMKLDEMPSRSGGATTNYLQGTSMKLDEMPSGSGSTTTTNCNVLRAGGHLQDTDGDEDSTTAKAMDMLNLIAAKESYDTNDLAALLIIFAAHFKAKRKQKENRRQKAATALFLKNREQLGQIPRMKMFNDSEFQNYTRMDRNTFKHLLELVTPHLTKQSRNNLNISPEERLSVTLRFLASGNSFQDLKFLTAISVSTIKQCVMETCEVLCVQLKDYIKLPENHTEWKNVSDKFYKRWNFPHCIGAIDEKHINITKPCGAGDTCLNYKNSQSIILMAIVNADYEFIMVEVGANGRAGDAGMLCRTKFYSELVGKKLGIPSPENLPNSDLEAPFVFVGDAAFPMMENLITPYPYSSMEVSEICFNQRLSRARLVVESAFGILASRFRIFQTNINLSPEKASKITLACCYLHNYIKKRRNKSEKLMNKDISDTECLINAMSFKNSNNENDARSTFKKYFNASH